ncbi:hypothetical protein [Paenibacillus doosanensis]|uniref:hypothetical protein n=1 Tax=Paenibacillus doosanensis TaxID=1229154 RepID=UPI0021807D6E|nr:hypothetical protein [Paenibacillus doosanensis]
MPLRSDSSASLASKPEHCLPHIHPIRGVRPMTGIVNGIALALPLWGIIFAIVKLIINM